VQYNQYPGNVSAEGCKLLPEKVGQSPSQQSTLRLVDEDSDQILYEYKGAPSPTSSPNLSDCPNGTIPGYGCILKTYMGPAVPTTSNPAVTTPTKGQITASTLRLKDFKVYILPICNPYSSKCHETTPEERRQPIVTITASVDVPEKGGKFTTRYVQTTVSSRVYRRLNFVCN